MVNHQLHHLFPGKFQLHMSSHRVEERTVKQSVIHSTSLHNSLLCFWMYREEIY